jgi:hypothetical protein
MLVGGVMIIILAFTLILLQQQFDSGDNNRAIELLMSRPPGAAWSVAEELDARAGAEHPTCTPQIVSSFAGTMQVSCTAEGKEPYVFAVDLVRKTVTPANGQATELLKVVLAKNAAAADGGVSTDAGGG